MKMGSVFIIMECYQDIDGGDHTNVASAAYLNEEEAQKECDKRNSTWAKHEAPYYVMELNLIG